MKKAELKQYVKGVMLAIFFLVYSPYFLSAQTTLRGKVIDENGESLPNASIQLKNGQGSILSSGDGTFSITVPPGETSIVVSFIGFIKQELNVTGKSDVIITMLPTSTSLEDVVVVGYGSQRRQDVTGSIASIKGETLQEVPSANLQQALQGRVPGLEIQKIGTKPGADAQIRIRGERTISGSNDPLIVLDGIPFEGSISDINSNDIQSLEVLKDASATAIYGSRGANGVILITTKRGVAGKASLSYNAYYGVSSVARKYEVFNAEEYMAMRDISTWTQGYMPQEVEGMKIGRNTDWQDLMYKNGYITDHSLTISGGSDDSRFSIGGGYFKETTVLPEQDFSRYSLRATSDFKIGTRIKVGLNSMNNMSINHGSQFGLNMFPILSLSPLMPAYDENGQIIASPAGNEDDQSGTYSPLLTLQNDDEWVDRVRNIRSFNSAYAEVEIIEGLKYRLNAGFDYRQQEAAQFQGSDLPNRPSYFRPKQGNTAYVNNAEGWGYTLENIVTYDKTFKEKHRLNVTGLYSIQEDHYHNTSARKDSVNADFLQYFDMGQANPSGTIPPELGGGERSWALISYMARINYAYDDRYMVTVTGRIDGSSRLADKWAQYPAVSLGWNIKNEEFMQGIDPISNLKLRAGWGKTSNQSIAPYTTLGGVSSGNIRYNYGDVLVTGYNVSSLPDKSLQWEYTSSINLGLDFELLSGRISGSIDWYKQKTDGILYGVNLPPSTGIAGNFTTNVGEMENKGMEFSLSTLNINSASGFQWSTDFNIFFNRNKLLSLNSGFESDIPNNLHIGQPLSTIYDYKKLGIWQINEAEEAAKFGQLPGQLKLADLNGDYRIHPDDDRMHIGSGEADWQGGMTNRFSYKGFNLLVVAYARVGGTLISGLHQPTSAYLTVLDGKRNGIKVDYWTPLNPTNAFPMPSTTITPVDASNSWSTLGYYDASFVKIRSIRLGYTFANDLIKKMNVQNLGVYLTAQNPFTLFSPYIKAGGVDPEPTGTGNQGVGNPGNISSRALTIGATTPPTRAFILGLNVTF